MEEEFKSGVNIMIETCADKSLKELYETLKDRLCSDSAPSMYLEALSLEPEFKKHPLSMLYALQKTEQSPIHHPEGNVWKHTLLVVDEAAKRRKESKNPKALMLAALLHDIGKPSASRRKNGRITAYDHDKIGAKLASDFLFAFNEDEELIENVVYLVRYHMQALYVSKRRDMLDLEGIREKGDAKELALLCLCDRLGRYGARKAEEEKQTDLFLRLIEKKEKV
jgi:putative nucleotidyltransferase with HDIG domain